MTNEILTFTPDGTPVIDSLTIAEGCQVQHKNVIELIRKYLPDFQAFGAVAFETRKGKALPQGGFAKATEVALLNEDQAMLLFIYLKNTEIARSLKVRRVVKAFRDCRAELATIKSNSLPIPAGLPNFNDPAEAAIAWGQTKKQLQASEKKTAELTKKLELAAPKVSAYDDLVDDKGTYTAPAVAKILIMKRNEFFTWARNNKVIYRLKEAWLPYARWVDKKWAQVKIDEGNNKTTGEPYSSKTLRFTTSGVFQIHKLMKAQNLKVPEQLDLEI